MKEFQNGRRQVGNAPHPREARRTDRSAGSFVTDEGQAAVRGKAEKSAASAPGRVTGKFNTLLDQLHLSHHRKGSVILLCALLLIALVLTVSLIVRLALLLVPVREMTMEGTSFYSMEEIAAAAGIETGDRMYGFFTGAKERAVKAKLPILKNVTIKRSLSGTLTWIVEEHASEFYVEVAGNYYILSREEYRVLAECDSKERPEAYGLYEISLPAVRVAFLGEILDFGEEGRTGYLKTLLDTLRESGLYERIDGIRASDPYRIDVILDGQLEISLGSVSDLSLKLENLSRMMASEHFPKDTPLVIDLTVLTAPSFQRVDAIDDKID